MSKNSFPHYHTNRKTGNKGVSFVKAIIEDEFDWIFRPVHLEDDFGLDGYLDILVDANRVTGKFLGVQIKTGDSYFNLKSSTGWTFTGENKHLNYYLNADFPILVVLVDLSDQKAYWVKFDIEKVDRAKNGWHINIPFANILSKGFRQDFVDYTGGVIDYMAQIEYQWEFNNKLKNSGLIYLEVSKSEIENSDVGGFVKLLERLTINDKMIEKTRGKVSFSIDGYNYDTREVFEIPAVKEWVRKVIPAFKYWGYFLNMEDYIEEIAGLRVLHFCYANAYTIETNAITKTVKVNLDKDLTIELLNDLFGWLNEFTEKHHLSEKINEEQTDYICKILTGERLK